MADAGLRLLLDKRLYDRISGRDVSGVRDHLRAGLDYQSRLFRALPPWGCHLLAVR